MSSKTNIPFVIKSNGAVTLYLSGECSTIEQDHPNYSKIVDALKSGNTDKIPNLINISRAVSAYGRGLVTVNAGQVFYKGAPVHNTLTERLLKMMSEGFKVDHMLLFLQNLMSNPSFRAVNETYKFLENRGLPITDDGCFLAYKAVRNNYFDIYTGKFAKNTVGAVVKMDRNLVNEDWGVDCAQGLHCGAIDYVVDYGHFVKGQLVPNNGNRLVIVKVNPANVVCVPDYAKSSKMRVCEYVVVDEIKDVVKELDKVSVYKSDATPAAPDDQFTEEDFEEECECSGCKPTSDVLDISEEQNLPAYQTGYQHGESDRYDAVEFGTSKDCPRGKSYNLGYSDGFAGRTNQADAYEDHMAEQAEEEGSEEDEYNAGYDLGYEDSENGEEFQANLEVDSSTAFKDGYRDGYNDAG
jgi:hypothetical protein